MTKAQIKDEAYIATNNEYVYDGHTAEQWREIERERNYDQRYESGAEARKIAEVLEGLND